jgi:hypothetical protein
MRVYLPGVAPTGRKVVLPHVVVMGFDEAGRVAYEHIYWDQATLLVQVGLLDPPLLPLAGAEQAKRLLDPTHPANEMIYRSRWNPRQWPVEKFSGKDADRTRRRPVYLRRSGRLLFGNSAISTIDRRPRKHLALGTNAGAQTRIVSVGRIRLDSRKSVRPFKGIFCGDISEFESFHASQRISY